jgi:hypothetical protein
MAADDNLIAALLTPSCLQGQDVTPERAVKVYVEVREQLRALRHHQEAELKAKFPGSSPPVTHVGDPDAFTDGVVGSAEGA